MQKVAFYTILEETKIFLTWRYKSFCNINVASPAKVAALNMPHFISLILSSTSTCLDHSQWSLTLAPCPASKTQRHQNLGCIADIVNNAAKLTVHPKYGAIFILISLHIQGHMHSLMGWRGNIWVWPFSLVEKTDLGLWTFYFWTV